MEKKRPGNPLIERKNPYDEMNRNTEELIKHHPEILEAAKLCYEVFECTDNGKKLLKVYEDRFLFPTMVNPLGPNAAEQALYWTGYGDCIRSIKSNILMYKQRINACQN